MPVEKFKGLPDVITYRRAIVGTRQVAAALHASEDLPPFGAGTRLRYLWGAVHDVLAHRALPTPAPGRERER